MALKLLTYAWLSIENHLQVILAWDFKIDVQTFIGQKGYTKEIQSMFLGFGMKHQTNRGYEMPWNFPECAVLGQCQAQAENSVATHFSSPLSSHKQAARLKWKCLVSGQPSQRFADCKPRMTSSTVLCPSRVIGLLDWLWIAVNGALSSLTFFAPGFSSGTNGPASTTTSSACRARHFKQSKWH